MNAQAATAARELEAEIGRRVRIRFALSSAEFASRVQELGLDAARLSLDDLYLAAACANGDEDAWREFSERHFEFMRGFARRFLPSAAARELADEVIAELWSRGRLKQYEGRSTLRTWLGAVVSHAALNSRKAMSRMVPLETRQARSSDETESSFESTGPASEEAARLLREMLSEAVRSLETEERLLLQLYYEQEMTLDEMSATLSASSAAISRRLKRTREVLRAVIEVQSRRRTGESAETLRAGLDLGRIELDLGKLFGGAV
ncbi:MAG: RNA polymerase sigma factor [Steroidobacteraceae bacterium]